MRDLRKAVGRDALRRPASLVTRRGGVHRRVAACGSKGSEPGHERGHNAQRPANAGATPLARDDWGRPARTSFVVRSEPGAGRRQRSAFAPESGHRADIGGCRRSANAQNRCAIARCAGA